MDNLYYLQAIAMARQSQENSVIAGTMPVDE